MIPKTSLKYHVCFFAYSLSCSCCFSRYSSAAPRLCCSDWLPPAVLFIPRCHHPSFWEQLKRQTCIVTSMNEAGRRRLTFWAGVICGWVFFFFSWRLFFWQKNVITLHLRLVGEGRASAAVFVGVFSAYYTANWSLPGFIKENCTLCCQP